MKKTEERGAINPLRIIVIHAHTKLYRHSKDELSVMWNEIKLELINSNEMERVLVGLTKSWREKKENKTCV